MKEKTKKVWGAVHDWFLNMVYAGIVRPVLMVVLLPRDLYLVCKTWYIHIQKIKKEEV